LIFFRSNELEEEEGIMAITCPKCQSENPEDTLYCGKCAAPLKSGEGVSVTKTFVTPADRLQEGTILAGKYRIVEELGRGGMGVVYKAEDTKLKRTVALKFLPPELTHIPEVHERFTREAQAAAALDHPNICTVYEFDQAEDMNFISMAYIEGQSLRKKIESGPLELEEALKIAAQVAEGLQEAHKKGVVHRDIKSANIMVTERGQAKIMDFGLARMSGTTLLTQEGTAMGTIAYMSPEQARGEAVDHRTDIWSLGVVMYEMLTGKMPFKGEHEQAVVYSILKEKPDPITNIKSDIPAPIEQVVSKALEKNLDDRYQGVEELLDDLRSISAGIVPEEIKTRLRKEKLRKRKKAILYAGAACLVILMAILAFTLFKSPPETIDSIAVLPLGNLTGDPEQDYFVDGVTDELIGQLGQISGLRRVISRTSVMQYKDTDKSLPEIARELNVDALVEGTVYQVGDNVSIKLQLFDALPEERSLWTKRYDRPKTDVLRMYNEIAGDIAENIQVKLTADETSRLAGARQVNTEAYEAYLKGMSSLIRLNPEDLQTGMHYLETALEKDPDFALAHAGVANYWCLQQVMGSLPPSETTPLFRAAAQKAMELDPTLAEVHYVDAFVKWFGWDWEGAEEAFKRTIEINPSYPEARAQYAQLLAILKRPEEAIVQARQSIEMDPFNPVIMGLYGSTLSMLGRYDEGMAMAQKELRLSPNSSMGLQILWWGHHYKGEYDQAFDGAKAFYAAMGFDPIVQIIEQGFETGGYFKAMRGAAEAMAFAAQEQYIQPYWLAILFAVSGEKEECLDWLEKGYETKDPSLAYMTELELRSLIDDEPRYQELLRKMNLPVGK
jgi:serine/threonine protein kinase/tetratricopeptide (TPR) repeat protein